MTPQTAVVLGATGLTGHLLVTQLLNDPNFTTVRVLVRRPFDLVHPKLEVAITDFHHLPDYRQKLGKGDALFCCIGTTQKKVKGDKALYRQIDIDIPFHAAQMALDAGFGSYYLISAVGANSRSGNFYLKIKGEVESKIASLGFKRFVTFRPGIILGERNESRPLERIGQGFIKAISRLLVGGLRKYRGIAANDIAAAMISAAKSTQEGMFVYHYEEIVKNAGLSLSQ